MSMHTQTCCFSGLLKRICRPDRQGGKDAGIIRLGVYAFVYCCFCSAGQGTRCPGSASQPLGLPSWGSISLQLHGPQ